MKHTFSIFTSAVLIVALTVVLSLVGFAEALKGDVNKDGKISVVDAKWILQNIAGGRELDSHQLDAADINLDGKVSVVDAKWVLQTVAGLRETPTDATPEVPDVTEPQQPDTTEPQQPEVTEPPVPDVTDPTEEIKEQLNSVLSQVKAIDLEYYTQETAQPLIEAIENAEVLLDSEEPSNEQLVQAIVDINTAKSGLKSLRECLAETVEIAKNYDLTACESDIITRLNRQIAVADRILAAEDSIPDQFRDVRRIILNTFDDIDEYRLELSQKKTELSNKLNECRNTDTSAKKEGSAYMPSRIEEFNAVIEKAQAVLDNPLSTKSEIEAEIKNLESANDILKTYKEGLRHSIMVARDVYGAEKLNGSPDLRAVIDDITKNVYQNPDSTDEDYIAAMQQLSAAVDEFHEYYLANTKTGIIDWT